MKLEWYSELQEWLAGRSQAAIAVILAGALAVVWLVYGPLLMASGRFSRRSLQMQQELADSRKVMERVRSGEARMLPDAESLPALLEQLHAQARKYNVQVASVSPGAAAPAGEGEPVVLPIELLLEGDYRSLGAFVAQLANSAEWAVLIRRFRISREERMLPRLRGQLSIELLMYRPEAK